MRHWKTSAKRLAIGSTVFGVGFLLVGACVNPRQQYDDYLDRTADARGGIAVVSDASFEGSAPGGGFTATYSLVCYPHLFSNVAQSLELAAMITFVPDGSGGGTISGALTPLRGMATLLSDAVGPPFATWTAPVDAQAQFDIDLGNNLTLPAASNPVQPAPIVFATAHLQGILVGQDKFCAGFAGHVTSPIDFPLDATLDFCLFKRASGTPNELVPKYTRDDFHCP